MILRAGQPPCPCKVFDANGLEWSYLTWLDTETGEAEQMVYRDGKPVLSECRTEVLRERVKLATPVLIVPMGVGKDG